MDPISGTAWLQAGSSVLGSALGGNKAGGPSSAFATSSGYLDGSGWTVNTAPGGSATNQAIPLWLIAAGLLVAVLALRR